MTDENTSMSLTGDYQAACAVVEPETEIVNVGGLTFHVDRTSADSNTYVSDNFGIAQNSEISKDTCHLIYLHSVTIKATGDTALLSLLDYHLKNQTPEAALLMRDPDNIDYYIAVNITPEGTVKACDQGISVTKLFILNDHAPAFEPPFT